jgi:antibiotic biosynthesis monooxygenase (ABM) superfamily enzyme
VKTLPGGFGAWFTGLFGPALQPLPASWKIAQSVLLGLYPTAMLLTIFVGAHTKHLGRAADMLLGNALGVILLQWVVMPVIQVVLSPWLRATGPAGRAVTIWGLVLILFALVGLMFLFRAVTG